MPKYKVNTDIKHEKQLWLVTVLVLQAFYTPPILVKDDDGVSSDPECLGVRGPSCLEKLLEDWA